VDGDTELGYRVQRDTSAAKNVCSKNCGKLSKLSPGVRYPRECTET